MHRQPDARRLRVRRLDPVATMGRDGHPVAGAQNAGLSLVLETQHGGAAQQHHPFGLGLILPMAFSARLPGRDDALDAQAGARQQRIETLIRSPGLEALEQIAERAHQSPRRASASGSRTS